MNDNIYLDVQHIWQLDPDSGIPVSERRSICAPVVVKMVLDFILENGKSEAIKLDEIIVRMQEHGGRVDGAGWKHSAGVSTMKDYGLIPWRRNWFAPSQDPAYFVEKEQYDENQVRAFLAQLHAEERVSTDRKEKALYCIIQSLKKGMPVIASVLAGFSDNEAYHQVVICGYMEAERGNVQLSILDPLLPANKQKDVSLDYFWKYYKFQSIFIVRQA